jgi:hypothetical protein
MGKPGRTDVIAAIDTEAEFTLVEAYQSRLYGSEPGLTPAFLRLCHGLLLHRIHARKPSYGLLVKRHGPAVA